MELIVITLAILAGLYMAWNIGANDVANAIGTSVGSGALSLKQAVIMAGILEFAGVLIMGSDVSKTIQGGIVHSSIFENNPNELIYGMLASLISAGVWLQIASYKGWPVSTTHSIIGAVVGFGLIVAGWSGVQWKEIGSIVSSWIISPLLGGLISYFIFSFITKKLLYRNNPLAAVKKTAPWLAFFMIAFLVFLIFLKSVNHIAFSFLQTLLLATLLGLLGFAVCWIFTHRIQDLNAPTNEVDPQTQYHLEKCAKYLKKLKENSEGQIRYQASFILNEIDQLTAMIQHEEGSKIISEQTIAIEKIFGYLQVITAAFMAFAHGANDVANAIGPLAAIINLSQTHVLASSYPIPFWMLSLGGIGIVIGLITWGWRVIATIGKKITELTPSRGFSAELGAAVTIVVATKLALPISTTHTLVGAVFGVGLARGIAALNLNAIKNIIISWVITVPIGAVFSILFFLLIRYSLQWVMPS